MRAVRGFTYLGVLFLIALLGLTAAMAGVAARVVQQREDERQLVHAGQALARAIERYHRQAVATSQGAPAYPKRLEDLLRDDRFASIERHLARIHVDPMTRAASWGLVRQPDGGIIGVHSLSERRPLRRATVPPEFKVPEGDSYRQWQFLAGAGTDAGVPAAPAVPASAPAVPALRSGG